MDDMIRALFDFQRFEQNRSLQALIDETQRRYALKAIELTDDALNLVSAAGLPGVPADNSCRV